MYKISETEFYTPGAHLVDIKEWKEDMDKVGLGVYIQMPEIQCYICKKKDRESEVDAELMHSRGFTKEQPGVYLLLSEIYLFDDCWFFIPDWGGGHERCHKLSSLGLLL